MVVLGVRLLEDVAVESRVELVGIEDEFRDSMRIRAQCELAQNNAETTPLFPIVLAATVIIGPRWHLHHKLVAFLRGRPPAR